MFQIRPPNQTHHVFSAVCGNKLGVDTRRIAFRFVFWWALSVTVHLPNTAQPIGDMHNWVCCAHHCFLFQQRPNPQCVYLRPLVVADTQRRHVTIALHKGTCSDGLPLNANALNSLLSSSVVKKCVVISALWFVEMYRELFVPLTGFRCEQ